MRPFLLLSAVLHLSLSTPALAQDPGSSVTPTVQDLSFLVGTWAITFEIYDTHDPDAGVLFTEEGTQTCEYDLELNGVPQFIVCRGQVTSDRGRVRTFQEAIRYGPFVGAFERVGIFSNWPATSREVLYADLPRRRLELRGELDVEDGMLERYEDVYQFDESFSTYERRNVANFSDMPVTEFNLTLAGTGRRLR